MWYGICLLACLLALHLLLIEQCWMIHITANILRIFSIIVVGKEVSIALAIHTCIALTPGHSRNTINLRISGGSAHNLWDDLLFFRLFLTIFLLELFSCYVNESRHLRRNAYTFLVWLIALGHSTCALFHAQLSAVKMIIKTLTATCFW